MRKFELGQRVTKSKGSSWTGKVVGFYPTDLTPVGYAVESETEKGSVQIYPESALMLAQPVSHVEVSKTAEELADALNAYSGSDIQDHGISLIQAALIRAGELVRDAAVKFAYDVTDDELAEGIRALDIATILKGDK